MQRRLIALILKIGLPVLAGQFLFDWLSNNLAAAVGHLPVRAAFLIAILFGWAAFREHQARNNQPFR